MRAFFFFYFVLCSWYSIRPVRNEMAVQAGLENLPVFYPLSYWSCWSQIQFIHGWSLV